MKKRLFTCCVVLLLAASSRAQTPLPAPEKERLIVDRFLRVRTVPVLYVEAVRTLVGEGFAARGRHDVIDAEAVREPLPAVPGSGVTTPETAAADQSVFFEMRAPEAAATGARYLVSGTVTDYRFAHAELPATDPGKPPRQGFRSTFRIVLSAVDLKLGERLPDQMFELTATAPVAETADRAALERIRGQLEYYIDRNFKFETTILELCPPDRKGRVRDLYIHSGTRIGVKQGDLFLVFEEVPIGGIMTRQKVGRLRVTDVGNPDVARCRIARGEAEIAAAFSAGRPLICVSDGKAFGF